MIFTRLVLSYALFSIATMDPTTISNLDVNRYINLQSQLVKVSTKIEFQNIGNKPISTYNLIVDKELLKYLSFTSAKIGDDENSLQVSQTTENKNKIFKVALDAPLQPNSIKTIVIEQIFAGLLIPHPAKITQKERQLTYLVINHYFYSLYNTENQLTLVKLSSSNVESYSKLSPSHISDDEIHFGPYSKISPFSHSELRVHFENNSPFLTITDLLRWIEVSHWGGNIAVEEKIHVTHSGAELKGSFSRFDYMYQRSHENSPSVKSYKTILPAGAKDVYYRDEIGNISTSNLYDRVDSVELELSPRFPLFGGWKTFYTIGYNLPSFQYLFNSENKFVLKMRLIDHVFDDMRVDNLMVKVVLPEGASNINVKLPYEAKRLKDELHFTFLDFSGRPVVVIFNENLVEAHIQDFEIYYEFQTFRMLCEPLMLVVGLFIAFMTFTLIVRLDFAISKDSNAESKLKVASYIEQILFLQDRRDKLKASFCECISKFKQSKDSSVMNSTKKSLDAEFKSVTSQIAQLAKDVREFNTELAERVNDLQKLEGSYRELINTGFTNAEKVVNNRLSKQAYLDADNTLNTKFKDVHDKIVTVIEQF